MNNTLTAKEWFEKECQTGYWDAIEIAEKYANYKNKILEDRIKEFGKELEYRASLLDSTGAVFNEYLKRYNKLFEI